MDYGMPARCWVRWNSQHSKNCVSLSSCWKTKSQEGNKSFVPELPRVVSVSSVFRIPMHMNILRIRIFVYFVYSYYGYVTVTLDGLSEYLRRSLMIFIIQGFRIIVFIFIVIFTTFRQLRNLDRRIEDDTRKLTTVRLSYVKGQVEKPERYVVHMTLGQYSQVAQLSRGISSKSSH